MNETNRISKEQHQELIKILEELIEIVAIMRKEETDIMLALNESEAREWLAFLKQHDDKEELVSLEEEISNRFVFYFDRSIRSLRLPKLDSRRIQLMRMYMVKSSTFCK